MHLFQVLTKGIIIYALANQKRALQVEDISLIKSKTTVRDAVLSCKFNLFPRTSKLGFADRETGCKLTTPKATPLNAV